MKPQPAAPIIERLSDGERSRDLDKLILQFVVDHDEAAGYRVEIPPDVMEQAPAYTTSVDAAITLLPAWSWRVGNLPSGQAFADLGTQKSMQNIEAPTPAAALCLAAMKARAA